MKTSEFPKICHCCRVLITAADWSALPFRGMQVDDEESLEYRDHGCGSTLAVVVPGRKAAAQERRREVAL